MPKSQLSQNQIFPALPESSHICITVTSNRVNDMFAQSYHQKSREMTISFTKCEAYKLYYLVNI